MKDGWWVDDNMIFWKEAERNKRRTDKAVTIKEAQMVHLS